MLSIAFTTQTVLHQYPAVMNRMHTETVMGKLVAGGLWAVFQLSSIIGCLFLLRLLLLLLLLSRTGYLLFGSFFLFQNHHYWPMLQWIKVH
jgi:hypothetical protein